jgi:hypothetical protein
MVRVGFIVEGTSDFIVLKSDKFQNLLRYNLNLVNDESLIRIAKSRSFMMKYLKDLTGSLEKEDIDYLFILVDQDDNECPMETKQELIGFRDNSHYFKDSHIYLVMTREMEAWFLADDNLNFEYEGQPEEVLNPSDIVSIQLGTSSHVRIANEIKDRFSLERAAKNAPSAKRFLDKLEQISAEDI